MFRSTQTLFRARTSSFARSTLLTSSIMRLHFFYIYMAYFTQISTRDPRVFQAPKVECIM